MMMLFRKTFQGKLEKANKVFNSTVERLKLLQADMTEQMEKNRVKMQKLENENADLDAMKAKAGRQIEEISKFIV
ncbi:hypothetical protein DW228_18280 [Bacteroides fragilis]|uniref:Uncharacterized protein n=1 Tax=Bacteroides fragilis TaxID=817 RepID=A0A396BSI1_BACFG|nr:hypothetical protein [Bacteroides fragilis]RHH07882.1 hypothetical protein DW228_18280 [Bacteroides fragilis]